jgi:hypothetical protein
MADRLAGELDRLYKAADEPGDDELVFPDPITGGPLDKAATCAATARCSKPRRLTRRTTCTGADTRPGPEWPPQESRCERCRSGWGTAIRAGLNVPQHGPPFGLVEEPDLIVVGDSG